MSLISEFIYLTFAPNVKPEDPENEAGRTFNDVLHTVKQMNGHEYSHWGRTLEDENNIVWVIQWKGQSGSTPLTQLTPLLAPNTHPIAFSTTLTPPITENLTASPTIELAALTFPSTISPSEKSALDTDLIHFRSVLLNLPEPAPKARSFSMGWVERPGVTEHPDSPSGKASLVMLVVGWGKKEDHEEVRKMKEFGEAIAPIRERMIPGIKGLEMRHVQFHSC